MPSVNEQYKHKQITDVVYYVYDVDKKSKLVHLRNIKRNEKPFCVTFAQLTQSYERIK